MAIEIRLPKLGETMEEGVISAWRIQEGDRAEKGQALFEVQTDKVNLEYESPVAGYLLKILIPANETVPVLTVVGYLGERGEEPPTGAIPDAVKADAEAEKPVPASTAPAPVSATSPGTIGNKAFISPRARRLSQEAGLDPATLIGTGPNGRVIAKDVEDYRRGATSVTQDPAGQRIALSPMRKIIARRLSESFATIPHFYLKSTADVTELTTLRATMKAEATIAEKRDVSVTDFMLRACAIALRDYPMLNASLDRDEIVLHHDVNLGVAVALDEGLIVPVVKRADRLSLFELSHQVKDLAIRARVGRLSPDEYTGGTFTLTNLGMFGVDEFMAIINPPEVAILAIGRAALTAVPQGSGFTARHLLTMTLSCDHRVIDGATGARFLGKVRSLIEAPYRLIV